MDVSVQKLYYRIVYRFIDKDQARKDCKFCTAFWQSFRTKRREWLLEACETMASLISLRNVGFFFRLGSMFCGILRRNLKAISLDRSLSVVARYSIEIYYIAKIYFRGELDFHVETNFVNVEKLTRQSFIL